MQFQKNVELSGLNTLALKAVAEHYCIATSIEDLIRAIQYANNSALTIRVLGEGSNVVLGDQRNTLVIDVRLKGIDRVNEDQGSVLIKVSAGENWHDFVGVCIAQGWYGLENLSLIPGRVGAAPIQNIGAYGAEVADYIESVEYILFDSVKALASTDIVDKSYLQLRSRDQCGFVYRDSIFKRALADKIVISAVYFRLQKQFKAQLSYPSLKTLLEAESDLAVEALSASQIADAVIRIRQQKLPDPKELPNVGSFFKNVEMSANQFDLFIKTHPEAPYFEIKDNQLFKSGSKAVSYKIPSGWLIEHCGLKGLESEYDGLRMHAHQALVMVNPKRVASAKAVADFAEMVQRIVQERYSVTLEIEPRLFL